MNDGFDPRTHFYSNYNSPFCPSERRDVGELFRDQEFLGEGGLEHIRKVLLRNYTESESIMW
jgi:hypothetical protein